jgi:hypothetical protein
MLNIVLDYRGQGMESPELFKVVRADQSWIRTSFNFSNRNTPQEIYATGYGTFQTLQAAPSRSAMAVIYCLDSFCHLDIS